jgi:cysteinyl-tRNA synthetase
MWEMLKSLISDADKKASLDYFDQVFGLNLKQWQPKENAIPDEVATLLEQRKISRANKNWAESDRIRDEIKGLGFELEDTSEGMKVKPCN